MKIQDPGVREDLPVIELKHNDRISVLGVRFHHVAVGTCDGLAVDYGEEPVLSRIAAMEEMDPTVWLSLVGGDEPHIEVQLGQRARIEGRIFEFVGVDDFPRLVDLTEDKDLPNVPLAVTHRGADSEPVASGMGISTRAKPTAADIEHAKFFKMAVDTLHGCGSNDL